MLQSFLDFHDIYASHLLFKIFKFKKVTLT